MNYVSDVVAIGGNHHNTLGVIRGLGYKGVYPIVVLVCNKHSKPYVSYSKFIKKCYLISSEDEIVNTLNTISKSISDKTVVIACSDGAASIIDQNRNAFGDKYLLPGTDEQGYLTRIMDKEFMSQLGRVVGFNVPETWIVETLNDIDDVQYPCITKPILSKDGRKSDIKICHTKEHLAEVINEGSCFRYQVQKFIEKDFEYQLIGLSLNGGEELIIPGFSRCIRPCPGTNTGFLHYESLDGFDAPIEKCKDFVKHVGYSGLFSIEFLRDKNGKDYFLEMNFRNDGNSICVTKAGYDLPYLWYAYNVGLDYKKILSECKFKEVLVMPELDDFNHFVRTRKISLGQWIKDVLRTDAFMEYDSEDPKPFWVALKQYVCRGATKMSKKIV